MDTSTNEMINAIQNDTPGIPHKRNKKFLSKYKNELFQIGNQENYDPNSPSTQNIPNSPNLYKNRVSSDHSICRKLGTKNSQTIYSSLPEPSGYYTDGTSSPDKRSRIEKDYSYNDIKNESLNVVNESDNCINLTSTFKPKSVTTSSAQDLIKSTPGIQNRIDMYKTNVIKTHTPSQIDLTTDLSVVNESDLSKCKNTSTDVGKCRSSLEHFQNFSDEDLNKVHKDLYENEAEILCNTDSVTEEETPTENEFDVTLTDIQMKQGIKYNQIQNSTKPNILTNKSSSSHSEQSELFDVDFDQLNDLQENNSDNSNYQYEEQNNTLSNESNVENLESNEYFDDSINNYCKRSISTSFTNSYAQDKTHYVSSDEYEYVKDAYSKDPYNFKIKTNNQPIRSLPTTPKASRIKRTISVSSRASDYSLQNERFYTNNTNISQINLNGKEYDAKSIISNDDIKSTVSTFEEETLDEQISRYERYYCKEKKISEQTTKGILAMSNTKQSVSRDLDINLKMEAERILHISQQKRLEYMRKLQKLKSQKLQTITSSPLSKMINVLGKKPFKTMCKLNNIYLKMNPDRTFINYTFAVILASEISKPECIKTTELLKLHAISESFVETKDDTLEKNLLKIKLSKPFIFKDLKPNFKIKIQVWLYHGGPLFSSPLCLSDKSRKRHKTTFGKVLNKFTTIKSGIVEKIELRRAGTQSTINSYSTDLKSPYRPSEFQANGECVITKEVFRPELNIVLGREPDERTPENLYCLKLDGVSKSSHLNNKLLIDSELLEEVDQEVILIQGYLNVFLPVVPPRWDYYYAQLTGKNIYLFKNFEDTKFCEKLSVSDYRSVAKATQYDCFRKFTIRLFKEKDEVDKTLISLDCDENLFEWLEKLNILVDYENSWRI